MGNQSKSAAIVASLTLVIAVALPLSAVAQSSLSSLWPFRTKQAKQAKTGLPFTASLSTTGFSDDLTRAVTNASLLLSPPAGGVESNAELLNIARGDYRRILMAFYENAYYGADISIRLNGREAASIPLTADLGQPVNLVITLNPGQVFTFGQTVVAPLPPADHLVQPELEPGEIAGSGRIREVGAAAIQAWRRHGNALARIGQQAIEVDHRNSRLDVALAIEPGPVLTFGAPEVKGTRRVDQEFVAYIADLPPGGNFDPFVLEQARDRLLRLGVFKSVEVIEGNRASPDGSLPITLMVDESKPRRFGFGAALSSYDGIRLEGHWTHRNLFGRAERLTLRAAVDGLANRGGVNDFDYSLGAEFQKPGVISPDINLVASITADRTQVLSVDTRSLDLAAGFVQTSAGKTMGLSGFGSFSRTQDLSGLKTYRIAGLRFDLTQDKRDNSLDASRGSYWKLGLSPFHEFSYANTGLRLVGDGRIYRKLGGSGRIVLATRAYFGSLLGVPLAESPGDYQFYSGGGGSVRGYDYQSLGITTLGVFSGGRSVVNLNFEVRSRLTETLGLVGFVDAGSVGRNPVPDFANGWYVGAGVGLRYMTAFGPLRVDLAHGLNAPAGDPGWGLYIGLGQAF
ncbi:MAG: outer membrane protein assembly factor [Rhodobacteraceae bacterium]|nr:outer membrane protein assembly factor [Paracoccaceae bacterium]